MTREELERRAAAAPRSVARLLPLFRRRLEPFAPTGSPLTDDRAPVEWLTDQMILRQVERGGSFDEPALPTAPRR